MITQLFTDVGKAAARGPRGWLDLARAALELALANRALARRSACELLAADTGGDGVTALTPAQRSMVERVAYAVPRMGARVPWRSDCLIQALAARRWLSGQGITSDLCIGARNEGEFAAHAWLKVGDRLVSGGEIADYTPLLEPGTTACDQPRKSSELSTNQR